MFNKKLDLATHLLLNNVSTLLIKQIYLFRYL